MKLSGARIDGFIRQPDPAARAIGDKPVRRVIVVPNRIVNVVV